MRGRNRDEAAIVYFSERGKKLAKKIHSAIIEECRVSDIRCQSGDLYKLTEELWREFKYLIFISSTGIAVRAISSQVSSKIEDPAVIVVDEMGKHTISLLSGHYGGANYLTSIIADNLKSDPVITTATDLHEIFAFDSFARSNRLSMVNHNIIKNIARHMIDKKENERLGDIRVHTPYKIDGDVPSYVSLCDEPEVCDVLIDSKSHHRDDALCLIPHNMIVGLGCRKDTSYEDIEDAFNIFMKSNDIFSQSVCCIASIDLKKEERGILEFCKNHEIPFYTYDGLSLSGVESPSDSDFVRKTTGVGCVCEASALYHSSKFKNSRLTVRKTVINHITFALCEIDVDLHWN